MQLRINYNNTLFWREVKLIIQSGSSCEELAPVTARGPRFPLTGRDSPFMMNAGLSVNREQFFVAAGLACAGTGETPAPPVDSDPG
jgi:hypothetical protein